MTEPASPTPAAPKLSEPTHYLRWIVFVILLGCLYGPGFVFDPYDRLPQFNRFLTLALFALSVDLIWGYTGLLSLGQGLYFGLGGYFVAYSLSLQKAALNADLPRYEARPDMAMTEYMFQGQLNAVPKWIAPLIDIDLALPLAIFVPTMMAALFGYVVFRRRIKGVYFSLITQALVYAFFTLVSTQRSYTGGVDGMPGLANFELFGFEFKNSFHLNLLIVTIICVFGLLSFALVHSKFGKLLTAIRDNEYRVMALGYDTAMYKTFVFAFAGMMAGVAGALSVCSTKSAGPQFFSIEESILVVIFVAVGGRGTVLGPILGTLLVTFGQDQLSGLGSIRFFYDGFSDVAWIDQLSINFTRGWPILLGALYIGVVLFLPNGILGGLANATSWLFRKRKTALSTNEG